jgi:hypothetical protein
MRNTIPHLPSSNANFQAGQPSVGYAILCPVSLHEISNDDGARVVNFATSTNLTVKNTMFPQRNIHKVTWMSPGGKLHNQIDNILIDRRRHSSILDVRSFRAADCDIEHYLVVAKVLERLTVTHIKGCSFIFATLCDQCLS